jgi:carboxylesterase
MDGIKFVSEPQPFARAVLLFHGMTGSPTELVYIARALHKAGFDVFCPTLPGHLKGREEVMRPTWQDWMMFAREEYDKLRPTYSQISVGGVCVGAVIATALSVERETRAILCMAPILKQDGWAVPWNNIFAWFPLWTPMRFFFVFPEGATLGIRDEKVRKDIGDKLGKKGEAIDCFPFMCIRQFRGLGHFLKRRLSQVKTPLLVIHSERDDVADISNGRLIYNRAQSKVKEFLAVKNSYHLVTLDKDRDLVNAKAVEFLTQQAGA